MNVSDGWGGRRSFAAAQGDLNAVTYLVRAGAWVDPHDDYTPKETPLQCASESGHIEIVRFLLAEGADPRLFVGPMQMKAEAYARGKFPEIVTLLRAAEDKLNS